MFGCSRRARSSRSRTNRSRKGRKAGDSSFTATCLANVPSLRSARYTAAAAAGSEQPEQAIGADEASGQILRLRERGRPGRNSPGRSCASRSDASFGCSGGVGHAQFGQERPRGLGSEIDGLLEELSTFAHVRGVIGTNRSSESECAIRGVTGSRSELSPEPRAGDAPIALYSFRRNAQDLRRFLDCQAADITKLHDFRLTGIELRETIQGAIEVLPETQVGVNMGHVVLQRNAHMFAAALHTITAACVLDEDFTHDVRGDANELRTILPRRVALRNQSQIDLMDQRGGLESVTGTFMREIVVRQATELRVDQRETVPQSSRNPLSRSSARRLGPASWRDIAVGVASSWLLDDP